ncbi:MAG: hypothetical protein HUU47_07220 [Bacteroidetes bacterium]|nr:hypothetical protein [Bacteroidota bacterium]
MSEIEENNQSNYNEDENKKNSFGSIIFPLLFAISFLVNCFLYYKYYKSTHGENGLTYEQQYKDAIAKHKKEKADLNHQLDDIKSQLEQALQNNTNLLSDNTSLKEQLDAKTIQLANKIRQASIANPKALKEAKAEIEKLKSLQKIFEDKNNQLTQSNKELIEKVLQTETAVEEAKNKAKTIEEEKNALDEKVKSSSLSVADLKVVGIRVKGSKEEETYKARQINKLKINFSLLENKLIEPGEKEIVVRLLGTSNEVLTEDNPTLTDSDKLSTLTKVINYQNDLVKTTIFYSQKAKFKKGTYSIELLQNDNLIGRASFILR